MLGEDKNPRPQQNSNGTKGGSEKMSPLLDSGCRYGKQKCGGQTHNCAAEEEESSDPSASKKQGD